ncbi:MAG: holo-ACP synthase [Dehalococcoidia bacterium]|nr:holo-ACP synthase [Dehalococcoidia bacterium]
MLVVGVDLVAIDRIARLMERFGDRFLRRVYTASEIAYCAGRAPSLAARFAAKEAMSKALGVGVGQVAFREIEVVADREGRPTVRLAGNAQRRAEALQVTEWAISLSHERRHAIAFVVGR